MDKNSIIGFILIAAVLIGFSYFNKPSEEEQKRQLERSQRDSVEYAQTQEDAKNANTELAGSENLEVADGFFDVKADNDSVAAGTRTQATMQEKVVTLENSKIKIDISTRGGQMLRAHIKGFKNYQEDSLYIFNQDAALDLILTNKNSQVLKTGDLNFRAIPTKDDGSVIMRYAYSNDQYIDFIYKLTEDDYMLKFDINLVGMQEVISRDRLEFVELLWSQKMRRLENSLKNEQRYSGLYYKYTTDDVKNLSESKDEALEVKEPSKWIAFKNQFFATVLIANDKIELALLDSKVLENEEYIKSCNARIFAPVKMGKNSQTLHAGFTYYLGPMSYSLLQSYDDNVEEVSQELHLDELVPLGWSLFRVVNKYFVIPLFNVLKSTGLSMGLVILLLTIIVKLLISPLTYKSFMSTAKMRVLRPQVEALGEKFPKKEQATEKQTATMQLYRQAGVNPMSGCIPMLMQMPLLIALFQFFPNAIDLRHESFLWATDLSTYDAIWSFPEGIPLIGGLHLSLFCILMTITNIVYTKFNMDATNTGQQQMPGMKWMMYLMPLIFFFVLNDYPSGLTYYYFLSLLITILLTMSFRWAIDEEKVLAKLEANKAKPKKKSGFMARLEEAQRAQQQQQKSNNKKKNR